jgi:hypothetical protein
MNERINFIILTISLGLVISSRALNGQYTGSFGNYQNSFELVPKSYKLFWNATNMTVTGEVNVKAQGWVGLGFSKDGRMAPANVMVVYANPDGSPNFSERYNSYLPAVGSYRTPNQNWYLLNYAKRGDSTIVKFSRPVTLCGPNETSINV